MRIKDIARISGVTPRTVRYYHKIGLIAEPARDLNNYRRYNVNHLVRLLRIRRLSALGFSLDEISGLLEGNPYEAKDALAKLDQELEAQIAELTQRRQMIAQFASSESPPDVPVELAQFNDFIQAAMTEDRRRVNQEYLVLVAHLIAGDEMPALVKLYGSLTQPGIGKEMLEIESRFSRLGSESDQAEIDALIDRLLKVSRKLVAETPDLIPLKSLAEPAAATLLKSHTLATTNAQQIYVLEEFMKRF